MSTKLQEIFIRDVEEKLKAVDYEKMYSDISETRLFDRAYLRRLCLLAIYLADDKRLSQYIGVLGHYETLLRDDKYTLILEELQRIIIIISQVVKPETNTNRLYI